jgi:serine O-acetyltransferase
MTNTEITGCEPDWSREHKTVFSWCPSRSLHASIRAYQRHSCSRKPLSEVAAKITIFRHRFWSAVTGADIPISVKMGKGSCCRIPLTS